MNIISKAWRYIQKYGGVSAAAVKLGMPRSTLYDMVSKTAISRQQNPTKNPAKIEPSTGQWMQSLHHSDAHFIFPSGDSACATKSNGAKITAGTRWFPHDGCVRKCVRCMAHAS